MLVSFAFMALNAQALVSVRGYYRSDGTYVRPHYRTNPDSSVYNNFSYNGYRTTGMSYGQAAALERSLNAKPVKLSKLSKREKKVYNCVLAGKTETYCKSVYMSKKK